MTPSNWNIFRVTGHLWGEFTVHRWIPRTKASEADICFFDVRLNKWLGKQSRGWWFAHYDVTAMSYPRGIKQNKSK